MGLFKKKDDNSPNAYDILKAFKDEAQKKADAFSEKFPVGTFVKEWFGRDEWNCTFCYISSRATVDLDGNPLTEYNIEQYKKYNKKTDDSCVYVNYIPINIYRLDDECCDVSLSNRFSLCEMRNVVKSSFEEYREHMLKRFNENIVHHKEQIKRDRDFIRDYRRRINRIDSDLDKAISILDKKLEVETKRKINKSDGTNI
jgi:hypothetical protein